MKKLSYSLDEAERERKRLEGETYRAEKRAIITLEKEKAYQHKLSKSKQNRSSEKMRQLREYEAKMRRLEFKNRGSNDE